MDRQTGGKQYELFKQSLEQFSGTRISTEIETDGLRQTDFAGLIDNTGIIEDELNINVIKVTALH